MRTRILTLMLAMAMVVSSLAIAGDDSAAQDEIKRIDDSVDVIQDLATMKEGPPTGLLEKAAAVVVIPGLLKAGLGVGGKHGKGVIMAHDADGNWGQPVFLNMTGGSFGFQIGVSSTDLVLILMRERDIREILNGEFTLGGEAGVAAGPLGRQGSAGTDVHFNAPMYSYSRSKGAFAGVSLEGSKLYVDTDANARYFKVEKPNANEIIKQQPSGDTPDAKLAAAMKHLVTGVQPASMGGN